MIYTAWGTDGDANHFLPGDKPPHPSLDDDPLELVWTIEADSWPEAINKFHALKGWPPQEWPADWPPDEPPTPSER